jgi:Spy/CpxP family protein refolding chaperone
MEKAALLENLRTAQGHAKQSKVNVEAQKRVIDVLVAMGKDPAAAERILQKLESVQTDDLSEMERILNALDDEAR